MEDIYRARRQMQNGIHSTLAKKSTPTPRPKSTMWEPPPLGWMKCNFDCSFRSNDRCAGIGWILRDANGVLMRAGMTRIDNVLTPLQGETLGFLCAMQQVWIKGWRNVWFEGDCMELDRIVN